MRSRTHLRIAVPVVLLTLGLSLITGCSSLSDVPQGNTNQTYSLTINTQASDTPEGLAARYGGEVISWHPEAGFAIVRSTTVPAGDAAVKAAEPNANVFAAPVVSTSSVPLTPEAATRSGNVWMGGWSAWSGGWSAWSGGWNAWSGGTSIPALPLENSAAFNLIRLPQAQQISRNYGAGVKVAVLDTGIDTAHPMFSGRLAPSSEWKDFVDGDTNPMEVGTTSDRAFGHGTGVAGIILQVAPRATILPIRVLNKDGTGNLDAVVQAVDWAIQRGAQVINLSLGSDQTQTSLDSVLQLAASRKVYVVASAGNEARSEGVTFPAATTYWAGTIGYIFGIGSANNSDILSSFSNYGGALFGIAPGESLYSAFPGSRAAAFTGTSFAAPIYAGALALGLKELPTGASAEAFSTYIVNSMRQGTIFSENTQARGFASLGSGRIQLENLIRNLPGWTPKVAYGSTNFIKNGTFETNSLTNWAVSGATISSPGRSGTYALRINPGQAVQQSITGLKPNTSYTLTAWTRVDSLGSSGCNSVTLSVYNHGGIQQDLVAFGTTYAPRSLTFTTGPTSTFANIGLNVWSGFTSAGYADDITLREAGY